MDPTGMLLVSFRSTNFPPGTLIRTVPFSTATVAFRPMTGGGGGVLSGGVLSGGVLSGGVLSGGVLSGGGVVPGGGVVTTTGSDDVARSNGPGPPAGLVIASSVT